MTAPYAASAMAFGAVLLVGYAVKRAALGSRPLVQSVVCWLRNSHNEEKQAIGGWRCSWCGFPGADLGSVAPLRRLYDRRRGGSIERTGW